MTAGNGSRTSPEKLKPGGCQRLVTDNSTADWEPTEDGVKYMVGRREGGWEVIHEGDMEVFQLLG
jgi:hypothetical protein